MGESSMGGALVPTATKSEQPPPSPVSTATFPPPPPTIHHLPPTNPVQPSSAEEEASEIDLDKDMLCPICMQIIKDAFMTACGHSFCYMCILTHLRNKSDCPCCSHYLTNNRIFPSFLLNKMICLFSLRAPMSQFLVFGGTWTWKCLLRHRSKAGSIHGFLGPSCLSVGQIWREIWVRKEKVIWERLVWHPTHVPKHSTITWMAALDRLPTKDRLIAFGLQVDDLYVIYRCEKETRDHLFFQCVFSKQIWEEIIRLRHMRRSVMTGIGNLRGLPKKRGSVHVVATNPVENRTTESRRCVGSSCFGLVPLYHH
ncbi:hypothetical protein F3Y22_tig00010533pilonHSYRG00293 [Hibiscus syriacus]|uniref:RING-type domain-containing protein n=1 Tax=Hibiscus syriacus TaxID=106335 RepID=A0A6A3C6G5_HIBSY|nr:hypothetical protein F3Y22_tig00010533pilonHSYRG00293 [Hibiscus syriacus]